MLQAINIHKVYTDGKKQLPVLKGIDLKITKGDFAAIVGPSGAGKSTLLHILGGLDLPSQGEVIFQGENIYKLRDNSLSRIRNRKIGFVFQFYHLLSEFTVLENVLMPALISSQSIVNSPQIREKAMELLKRVGLSERAGHFPAQLSGGEKQRAAIARGLINGPDLLLCDEPTGNLDSKSGEEVLSLIKQANKSREMTVVLVTHNQALAESADKIYQLKDGVLVH
ncbi:MAG: ABC transporter ATP-binding protein [Candidatus Omnitrophota bacterium]